MNMRKIASVLITLLLLGLLAGCSAERANVDISDGGDLSAPVSSGAEPTANAEDTEPQEEADEPVEPEYITLSYDGNTASVTVDSVYLDEDGKLAVTLAGTGYSFNGILPFRNGSIVVPFRVDARIGASTYSWDTASFGSGTITYLFDVTELPEQVVLYSSDNRDEQFVFDAAPFIKDGPPADEQQADESEAPAGLAGRWEGVGYSMGDGEEIRLKLNMRPDDTGTCRFRLGGDGESYPIFFDSEAGSFSVDTEGNSFRIAGCGGTYVLSDGELTLLVYVDLGSAGNMEFAIKCERVPPAETVTDEPYTMVTSKFSVSGLYTGEWRDGKPNGTGTLTIQETNDRWDTGDTLWSEDWEDGLIEGYGEWRSAVDGAYDGNFNAGLKGGYGKMWFSDGRVYDGQWSAGTFKG